MKQCSKCKETKPYNDFNARKDSKDGYRNECKACLKDIHRSYYVNNSSEIIDKKHIYYNENRINILFKNKQYRKIHPECRNINLRRAWRNSVDQREKVNKRRREKYSNNSSYRITTLLRNRIKKAVNRKCNSTRELIGCSVLELKKHLQNTAIKNGYLQFDIENYDSHEYHIDHIAPCSKFNLNCKYHQKLCFHWTNLQILDRFSNQSKSASELIN